MKFKTTAKAIRANYARAYSIDYCGAQNLLHYRNPSAYTCGVYGWNFDMYDVNGVALCTGYRGMVGKSVNYELLKKYDAAAEKIIYNKNMEYDEKKNETEKLLAEFVEALRN